MEKRIEILERKLELVIDALLSSVVRHEMDGYKSAIYEMQRELMELNWEMENE